VFRYVFGGVRGCDLGELAGSGCVLFLREQVRDLWVQELLRELIVGVVAPSDLAGSIIVEILYCGKGGAYSKWLEPRNNSPMFAIAHLSLSTHLCLYLACLFICA